MMSEQSIKNDQPGKTAGKQSVLQAADQESSVAPAAIAAAQTQPTARGGAAQAKESRAKFKALSSEHMPKDFSISLDAYRRGGTDAFLGHAPKHAVAQSMRGFEPTYVNVVDYIVRITHQIWEEKDIGYIYDTYSHDCAVWDDLALQFGRDKIVADTIALNNGFPDIRIVADEVIWAGDDTVGFHTSHRTRIIGTNTGYTRYGEPTGKRVQFWCLANCIARDNEIFHEHVVYDTASVVQQLGYDVMETARKIAQVGNGIALPKDFLGSEPRRTSGQSKPPRMAIPADVGNDPEPFVRAALHTIWNRRNLSAISRVYHESVLVQVTAGRNFHGHGQLQSFTLSLLAMFPDMLYSIDDVYWMGNAREGYLVAIRWSMLGTHRGHGRYGAPTGKEINLWGITHWVIEDSKVTKEWTMFNEFGVLMQIAG
ncbi:ester cyclase [Paraburkholderia sediminicola]|uniref:ester cyclase n=1 Tax=Paraburkholderia sediminicola TaxID=458836 RepID=UPI0038B8DA3E